MSHAENDWLIYRYKTHCQVLDSESGKLKKNQRRDYGGVVTLETQRCIKSNFERVSPARTSNQKRFISRLYKLFPVLVEPFFFLLLIPNIFPNGSGLQWVNTPLQFLEIHHSVFFLKLKKKSQLKERWHYFFSVTVPFLKKISFSFRLPVSQQ